MIIKLPERIAQEYDKALESLSGGIVNSSVTLNYHNKVLASTEMKYDLPLMLAKMSITTSIAINANHIYTFQESKMKSVDIRLLNEYAHYTSRRETHM